LGPDDDAVADTLQWIASVYRELEKHQHALEYFNEALRIKKLTVGKDHIETGNVCHNLGIVYDDLGQYKMSVKFYQEALRIRKLCLGKDDELIAESLHLMANVFLRKGDKKNSLQYYEDAIHIREQRLSLQPPNWGCASNKNNSTIEKLLECYEEVLPLKKLLGGNVNSGKEVAKVTYRIAELHNKYMRNVDKAIDYFKAFVNLQAKILSGAGDDDQQERILLNNALQYLGTLYEEKQDYQVILQILLD
jgi:tetratricopeptide (TPR) repeat protein